MLDSILLQEFCSSFFGYGSEDAKHWFLSMEEGGGNTEEELQLRINIWHESGRPELADIAAFHKSIEQKHWFDAHPRIQKTWAAMIRVVLSYDGLPTDTESVRRYQRDHLGRAGGSTRLSPLLPLPSRKLADWNYNSWTDDTTFSTRLSYQEEFLPSRISHLSRAVTSYMPRTVTFLGLTYLEHWQKIAGTPLLDSNIGYAGMSQRTSFVACKHPAVQGVTSEYFAKVGMYHRDA